MNTERAQVGWGFWALWMLASSVGFAVILAVVGANVTVGFPRWLILGVSVAYSVGDVVGFAVSFGLAKVVVAVVVGTVVGAPLGIAQWLVLRRQISRAGWWVLATSVGVAVTLVVGVSDREIGWFDLGLLARLAVLVVPLGISQWLVLRRQIPRAGWWMLATIVGVTVTFAVVGAVDGPLGLTVGWVVGYTVGGTVGGAVGGAITGGVMVWLLRQPAAKEVGPPQAAE